MTGPASEDVLREAIEAGRVNALAARGHRLLDRDLARVAPGLDGAPLDATQLGLVAQIGARCTPWLSHGDRHTVNLAGVFTFVADWLVDRRATALGDIDALIERCVAVGRGAGVAAADGVGARLVAAIRDGLGTPDEALRAAWVAELERFLVGQRVEWRWRAGTRPGVEEYLANTDNIGLRFALATVACVDGAAAADIDALSTATDATALVIRLANDLAGAAREREYGDLNALTLGLSAEQVGERIQRAVEHCRTLFAAAPAGQDRRVSYLARVLGFNLGVYDVGDYWAGGVGG